MSTMAWPAIGTKFGERIVVDVGIIRIDPSGRERPAVMLQCKCGNRDLVAVAAAKRSRTCPRCAEKGRQWTDEERRAHAARIAAGRKRAARKRAAADAKAVRSMKTRRRRRILAAEAG